MPVKVLTEGRDAHEAAAPLTIDFSSLLDRLKARHMKQASDTKQQPQQQPAAALPDVGAEPPPDPSDAVPAPAVAHILDGQALADPLSTGETGEVDHRCVSSPAAARSPAAAAKMSSLSPFLAAGPGSGGAKGVPNGSTTPSVARSLTDQAAVDDDDDLEIVEEGRTPGKALAVSTVNWKATYMPCLAYYNFKHPCTVNIHRGLISW